MATYQNPGKINAVRNAAIEVAERPNANVPVTPHAARYMATKRDRLGHLLNDIGDRPLERFPSAPFSLKA
jgi:hypothetical protein